MFRTDHFVLYVRPNQLGHARLGVVVAKRLAPRAVTRNQVKRITRELFRRGGLRAVDCIVRLNKPLVAKRDSATSLPLRRTLFDELSRLLQSQHAPTQ